MKIRNEIECKTTARATLSEDGEMVIKVIATTVYDEKSKATTSAYLQVPDKAAAAVKAALEAAMKACEPQMATNLLNAIYVSREAGKLQGEIK